MFAALVSIVPAQAGIMHSDATLITYTDFGQNTGRYKTTESANALLQALNLLYTLDELQEIILQLGEKHD